MRSKLFVPGSRPELFDKALRSDADALSIDLEDAVREERKEEARSELRTFLDHCGETNKIIIVRMNGLGTSHWQRDLAAIVHPRVAAVNVPKLEDPEEIAVIVDALEKLEVETGRDGQIWILANIESPRGLRRAAEIAGADPRIFGLQLGFGDLFEPLGIDRGRPETVAGVQLAVRLAAGEAGVPAYDSAFTNVSDPDAFRAEALQARLLGFAGKSCIHPSQIAAANEVFAPSEREIARAISVMTAARKASASGLGAFMVEGRMVDSPFIESARAVLKQAGLSEETDQ